MDHVAIMKKSWKLLDKIISGEKRIESRWYRMRVAPWNKIKAGDKIYFKDGGEPVTVRADVEKVVQYEGYSERKVEEIIKEYGGVGGICFYDSPKEVFKWAKERKYCILMFLKNPERITPFEIDKTGYGNGCAWITVEDIKRIKK